VFEDLLGGLGTGGGMAAVVPAVDEDPDGCDEVCDAGDAAAVDGLRVMISKKDLDHVQPGSTAEIRW
jgi:hypothetical protein